jgi:uncharacterized protein (UPF0210 family)
MVVAAKKIMHKVETVTLMTCHLIACVFTWLISKNFTQQDRILIEGMNDNVNHDFWPSTSVNIKSTTDGTTYEKTNADEEPQVNVTPSLMPQIFSCAQMIITSTEYIKHALNSKTNSRALTERL